MQQRDAKRRVLIVERRGTNYFPWIIGALCLIALFWGMFYAFKSHFQIKRLEEHYRTNADYYDQERRRVR